MQIIETVAGRRPISAAMGELDEQKYLFNGADHTQLLLLKIGMLNRDDNWRNQWIEWRNQIDIPDHASRAVLVCYVDNQDIDEIINFASEVRPAAILLDTAYKDGRFLLDHVPLSRLSITIAACRHLNVPIALAGSLDEHTIGQLLPLQPDWFAVRSAACVGGRTGRISAERVRRLASLINPACPS